MNTKEITLTTEGTRGVKFSCALRLLLTFIGLTSVGLGIARLVLLQQFVFAIAGIITGASVSLLNLSFLFRSTITALSANGAIIREVILCLSWIVMLAFAIFSMLICPGFFGMRLHVHKDCNYYYGKLEPICHAWGTAVFALAVAGLVLEIIVLGWLFNNGWMTARRTNEEWRLCYLLRGGIYPNGNRFSEPAYYNPRIKNRGWDGGDGYGGGGGGGYGGDSGGGGCGGDAGGGCGGDAGGGCGGDAGGCSG